ncbi:hypothetical protein LINPERHAP2_LOCUS7065 [Linum perenne]
MISVEEPHSVVLAISRSYTVDICGVADLPIQGPKYTWARNNILICLDRSSVNTCWLNRFRESSVLHLHKIKSDNRPIQLCPLKQVYSPNAKPFRFLSAWFSHANFKHVINHKWNVNLDLPGALCSLTNDLCHWNKFVFVNIFVGNGV